MSLDLNWKLLEIQVANNAYNDRPRPGRRIFVRISRASGDANKPFAEEDFVSARAAGETQRVQLPSRRAQSPGNSRADANATPSRKYSPFHAFPRFLTAEYDEYLATACRDFSALSKMRLAVSRKICRPSSAPLERGSRKRTRAPLCAGTAGRFIMHLSTTI